MENLKEGDIVNIRISDDLKIVVTHVKDNKFQGVYFNSFTHEFHATPMLPIKIVIKVKEVNE